MGDESNIMQRYTYKRMQMRVFAYMLGTILCKLYSYWYISPITQNEYGKYKM